jgi:hypothetical protein
MCVWHTERLRASGAVERVGVTVQVFVTRFRRDFHSNTASTSSMSSMQRRGNTAVRSVRPLLASARPTAFQLSSRLLSTQRNEPITHNMQYQVTAIARQKHQRAYHHKEAYTKKVLLLAASAAATATLVLAPEPDHSQCQQSSDSKHSRYDELIYERSMSDDWAKVAALYEEMITKGLIPTLQTSLWAVAAYIDADQEYEALPIIEGLAEGAPNGAARLLWANAYMRAERAQIALDILKEPMPTEGLDRARHYHLCSIYYLTDRLEDLEQVMQQRQPFREAHLAWLREIDFPAIMSDTGPVPDELVKFGMLLIYTVYGNQSSSFQILDSMISEGYVLDDKTYDLLNSSCKVHGRTDLQPLLWLMKSRGVTE